MIVSYKLINSFLDPRNPHYVIAENLDEEQARNYARTFGFKKKMVDKLVNHTSAKYKCITCKDVHLIKVTEKGGAA